MKLAAILAAAAVAPSAVAFTTAPAQSVRAETRVSETKADLETLGPKLNPIVGYFDPLSIADSNFWGTSSDFTIGWLRQAEIKHGRVAMAAFVGYCVQSNFQFPWAMTLGGSSFPGSDLSPPEQWDAIPLAAKIQIVIFVGFLEWYSELTPAEGALGGQEHYTKGGQPGKYPTFDAIPHTLPFNLYDPFKFSTNMTEEQKERRLRAEINNGRLAQLGIFGFLCAQTIPGSVPVLEGIVKPYSGEIMAPFQADFTFGN